jgi:hypothetical protein
MRQRSSRQRSGQNNHTNYREADETSEEVLTGYVTLNVLFAPIHASEFWFGTFNFQRKQLNVS